MASPASGAANLAKGAAWVAVSDRSERPKPPSLTGLLRQKKGSAVATEIVYTCLFEVDQ